VFTRGRASIMIALSPRFAVTAVFAAFGVIGGIWVGSIPAITKSVGLTEQDLGFVLTLMVLLNVAAFVSGGRLARWISGRRMMLVMLPAAAVMLCAVLASPSYGLFLAAALAFSMSHGYIDLFMNAEGAAVESEQQRPLLTGMHATASLTVAVCALLGSLMSVTYGPLTTVPIVLAAGLAGAWAVWRGVPLRPLPELATVQARPAAFDLGLVLLGLAVGFATAGELVAFFWSAKLLDTEAPSLAAISGIGTAFLCGCAGIARLFGDRVRQRYGDRAVVLGALAVSALGMIGVGVTDGFVLHVVGFAVIGIGTAYLVPCLFAIAAKSAPNARAARIGLMSLIGSPARISAPFVFGWIAQQSGASVAFGLFSLAMIIAAGLFLASQSIMGRTAVAAVHVPLEAPRNHSG
jgi:predicted MFS family arabinose efflux permease